MTDIWKKCPKNNDVLKVEAEVQRFLNDYNLIGDFSIEEIEQWIYHCPSNQERSLFDPILNKMNSGSFFDLLRFNKLFNERLFAHVPQKILNGLSPVKYTLLLKHISQ